MRWALRGGEQSIGGGMGEMGESEASLAILCLMGLLSRVNPTLSGPWSSWNSDLVATLVGVVNLIGVRRPPSSQIFALWARVISSSSTSSAWKPISASSSSTFPISSIIKFQPLASKRGCQFTQWRLSLAGRSRHAMPRALQYRKNLLDSALFINFWGWAITLNDI